MKDKWSFFFFLNKMEMFKMSVEGKLTNDFLDTIVLYHFGPPRIFSL